jgi:uncharacterized membrane protein (UPF0127 family)
MALLWLLNPLGEPTTKKLKKILVGNKTVYVELALTPLEHSQGLKFRTELGEDQGMLFVFSEECYVSFWMEDTPIPLSIAFITEDGLITQIESMEPLSLESHPSQKKVKYVLEMERGWFEKNHIHVGDKATIPPDISER